VNLPESIQFGTEAGRLVEAQGASCVSATVNDLGKEDRKTLLCLRKEVSKKAYPRDITEAMRDDFTERSVVAGLFEPTVESVLVRTGYLPL
jgi:hypothetical protein